MRDVVLVESQRSSNFFDLVPPTNGAQILNIMNLFRIIKQDFIQFVDQLIWQNFTQIIDQKSKIVSKIHAAKYIYLYIYVCMYISIHFCS